MWHTNEIVIDFIQQIIMTEKKKKAMIAYDKHVISHNLRLHRIYVKIIENGNKGIPMTEDQFNFLNQLITSENNCIRQKGPNISDQCTESFVYHLLKDRKILNREIPFIDTLERRGNVKGTEDGADIVINGRTKIEVKATTSKTGFTSASLNNKNVFAAVFLDFHDNIKNGSEYIKVYVLKDPQSFKKKVIETTKEEKLTMLEEVAFAKKYGMCDELDVHINEYLINSQPSNIWFGDFIKHNMEVNSVEA